MSRGSRPLVRRLPLGALAALAVATVIGVAGYVVSSGGAGGLPGGSAAAVATATPPSALPGGAARDVGVPPPTEATALLAGLAVKGRASATGYERTGHFGRAWQDVNGNGCDTRDDILARDLTALTRSGACTVVSGTLDDPYTGDRIAFARGKDTSALVQIDHVVALLDAWQTGAQSLSQEQRLLFANDPLNLVAVEGAANRAKGAGDAATWLPPNRRIPLLIRGSPGGRQSEIRALGDVVREGCPPAALRRLLTPLRSTHAITRNHSPMTPAEAAALLGLPPTSSQEEILRAYGLRAARGRGRGEGCADTRPGRAARGDAMAAAERPPGSARSSGVRSRRIPAAERPPAAIAPALAPASARPPVVCSVRLPSARPCSLPASTCPGSPSSLRRRHRRLGARRRRSRHHDRRDSRRRPRRRPPARDRRGPALPPGRLIDSRRWQRGDRRHLCRRRRHSGADGGLDLPAHL